MKCVLFWRVSFWRVLSACAGVVVHKFCVGWWSSICLWSLYTLLSITTSSSTILGLGSLLSFRGVGLYVSTCCLQILIWLVSREMDAPGMSLASGFAESILLDNLLPEVATDAVRLMLRPQVADVYIQGCIHGCIHGYLRGYIHVFTSVSLG